tara:strand:- start:1763 stop:1978 length:216 start_codon:yes stop_codon:yes gene_type:complete
MSEKNPKIPSFLFRLYISRREAKLILDRLNLSDEEIEEKPWKGNLQQNLVNLIKRSLVKKEAPTTEDKDAS